ncbi:Short-chain dehydrogenase/reductase SDR [Penicillium crustosum]|uniref:Short-chain dehydrogenase/reductase SDR n=1 Tax=Penicillium crustosum TaxID=36656 RepID=UPI002387F2FB|nr:Short-chain dehydrogenase/reductase SDR [Penicillium crustosum]KAJ5396217.1 Short-chain dehydrogenase/reductase SDR [Penicillium crustosum]
MADLASLPKDWILTSSQFTRKAHTNVYPAIHPGKADNSLKGKTVVVTGASRGIGARGIAPAFVEAGVKAIVLIATNPAKLVNVEEELKMINPDLETLSLSVDVSSRDQVAKAWLGIKARYHRVDILVNNAGVESTDSDKTHEQDPDIFFRNFEVNVKGTHIMTQQFLKAAVSWATTANPARVINMSSSSAWGTWPFLAAYSNSKAALIHYTTTLAASYPGMVLAIAVNPGLNDTDIIPQTLRAAGFNFNDPALTGATLVWLTADPVRSQFLNGRVVTVEWDVEELMARKEEITKNNLLTMQLNAVLGKGQFAD